MHYYEKVVLPSEIYTGPGAQTSIQKHLNDGYVIIDFRPPAPGDVWISTPGGLEIMYWEAIYMKTPPRFIVQPPRRNQQLNEVWE